MPHIAVYMFPGRDNETKKDLSLKLREFLAKEMNLSQSIFSVSIEDVPREDWGAFARGIPDDTMFVSVEGE